MPNIFSGNTFEEVYRDDYRDSDGYHRVLFNSGRPLQARELTQLQTILQNQISRMADNLFLDGAAVSPQSSGASTNIVDYIVVESVTTDLASDFIGVTLEGPSVPGSAGVRFLVTDTLEAEGDEPPVLYGRYVSARQDATSNDDQPAPLTFEEGQVLTDIVDANQGGIGEVTVYTQPAGSNIRSIGRGMTFSMQQATFYTQKHFVYAPKQSVVIGKYSTDPTVFVGFEIVQDIVTVLDDEALYDNQGARPNLSSPGADRYRIRLLLTTKNEVADPDDFIPFSWVRLGVITQIKDGTDSYNMIERRMAERQDNTTGNFIVNDFLIRYEESGDSDKFLLVVPEKFEGDTPTAFLDGFMLEQKYRSEILVDKPRSFETFNNFGLTTDYKNYVRVRYQDSGLDTYLPTTDSLAKRRVHALLDSADNSIGTTRIKSIRNMLSRDSDHTRVHLMDVRMGNGQNFRDVRKIAEDSAVPARAMVLDLEDQSRITFDGAGNAIQGGTPQLFITQPEVNNLFFPVEGQRAKAVANARFAVQREDFLPASSNQISMPTLIAGEEYTDEGQWIVIDLTTGNKEEIGLPIISGGNNENAIINVQQSSGSYVVYSYVQKTNSQPKIKEFTEGWFDVTRNGNTFEFANLFDGVELLEAYDTDSDGSDLLHLVDFDGGQRDNYYGPATINGNRISDAVTSLRVKVSYFNWLGGGDYFSVNSYSNVSYGDIPSYRDATGKRVELHNVLDFRGKLDTRLTENTSADDFFEIPRDGDRIVYDYENYNGRVDDIVLGYNPDTMETKIIVNKGEEVQNPRPPVTMMNQMVLFTVSLGGNTKDTEDMRIAKQSYPRYRMSDIAELEKRVVRLEDTVSLSFLEQATENLVELDADGNLRTKTGFFVDDFTKGMRFTASTFTNSFVDDVNNTTQTLDDGTFRIAPKTVIGQTNVSWDEAGLPEIQTRTGLTPSNTKIAGDMMYLDYIEVQDSALTQEVISWRSGGRNYEEIGYYNVNPFNVFAGEGFLRLFPGRDIWFDNRRIPDNIINGGTVRRLLNSVPLVPRTWTTVTSHWTNWTRTGQTRGALGGWMDPERGWVRPEREETRTRTDTVRTFTQTVRTRVVREEQMVVSRGDRRVAVDVIPFMRARRVLGKAEGMRPFTRYWLFFDGIRMDKWTLNRTAGEFTLLRTDGTLNANRNSVSVTTQRHPATVEGATSNVLLSDANGTLHFDLYIPNNAPVPVNGSTQLNSLQEWEKWIAAQRVEAQRLGDIKDPGIYDQIGWKFRAGTRSVKLLDISDDNEEACLSKARSVFTSSGTVNILQRQLVSTRVILEEQFLEQTESVTVTTETEQRWIPYDPLAQTFSVNSEAGLPGVFVTSVDVFLRSAPKTVTNGGKDEAIPLQLQVRGVRDGTPMSNVLSEQHRKFVTADSCYSVVNNIADKENIADVLANPVTFRFDEPFFLRADQEYAIVLLAECDDYQAYVGTTYELILGKTNARVAKQPATGSLFLSQNGSTWTPTQNQDLAYRIKTAKFKANGGANFYSEPLSDFQHNISTSLSVDENNLNRFRVDHLAHNLGVGDKIRLRGLDSATEYPAGSGIFGSEIMDSLNVVDSADFNGYFVRLQDSAAAFATTGRFGSDSVNTNHAFNFESGVLTLDTIIPERTNIVYKANMIDGYNYNEIQQTGGVGDTRFNKRIVDIQQNEWQLFNEAKYIAARDQENSEIGGEPSLVFSANISTDQLSGFGDRKSEASALGYVSDISPAIDLQTMGFLGISKLVDNQPWDSDNTANRLFTNKPGNYVPETHPTNGTSPSKHITKVILNTNVSNGLRVFLDMYKPPLAEFDLYYRTIQFQDEDMYQKEWIRVDAERPLPASGEVMFEPNESPESIDYTYLIGGPDGDLEDFVGYQLKVVFRTTDITQHCQINNIRAIAFV